MSQIRKFENDSNVTFEHVHVNIRNKE